MSLIAGVVWSINLLVGSAILVLAFFMLRRPERAWVGVRVARTDEERTKTRGSNLRTAPVLILIGAMDAISGPVSSLAGVSPLTLAGIGLGLLLAAIVVIAAAAISSR